MNAPDPANDATPTPFAYDEHLRALYAAQAAAPPPVPPARVWENVQAQLAAPASVPLTHRRRPLLAGTGGVVVGILLMLGLGWWREAPAPMTAHVAVVSSGTPLVSSETPLVSSGTPLISSGVPLVLSGTPLVSSKTPLVSSKTPLVSSEMLLVSSGAPLVSSKTPLVSSGAPLVSRGVTVLPAILLPLIQTETALAGLGADTARATRERRTTALLAQRAALVALSRRTDSLLLALGVAPQVLPALAADSLPPSTR